LRLLSAIQYARHPRLSASETYNSSRLTCGVSYSGNIAAIASCIYININTTSNAISEINIFLRALEAPS